MKRDTHVPFKAKERLDEAQILKWADAHRRRTGKWPEAKSGEIAAKKGETWRAIDRALRRGLRGLPGGDSLARLLARARSVRNPKGLGKLTVSQIVKWADEHRRRTGRWPHQKSGEAVGSGGETWAGLNRSLMVGGRGLGGGSSLGKALALWRGAPYREKAAGRRPLTEKEIIAWAQDHKRRTGRLPSGKDGVVHAAPDETWHALDEALRRGGRGLAKGSSLAKLLGKPPRTKKAKAEAAKK